MVYYTYSQSFAGSAGQYQENEMYEDRGSYFQINGTGWWGPTRTEPIYENREYTEYRSCPVVYNYTYSYEKWGDWSDWSTNPVTANSSTEVNTQTQYRYRDRSLINTYYYERWGDWSVWQSGSATASASREVEVRYRYREK